MNLLREALNYLERLPAHPMTYAMALKIRNHLSNPQTLALVRRLHEAEAAEKFSRHGHSANFGFTKEGLPTNPVPRMLESNDHHHGPSIRH